jgi:hypothetical protein
MEIQKDSQSKVNKGMEMNQITNQFIIRIDLLT